MNRAFLATAVLALAVPSAGWAQHAGHQMPMPTPAATPAPDPHAGHQMPMPAPAATPARDPHAGHTMPMPVSEPQTAPTQAGGGAHAGHAMPMAAPAAPVGPPPAAAFSGPEHAADTVYDPALMADTRRAKLIREHGGMTTGMLLVDRLEHNIRNGRDGYLWDAQGWYGSDYDKLWLKSEGEGEYRGKLEQAEVQALYSRAIAAFFDVQAGVRHDFRPGRQTTHLALGIQGLARYWFEVDAAVFLSHRGDVTARLEAEYDQRITNKLILQPRVEFNLAAQDVKETDTGRGLSSAEAGLRLRYQLVPEFAPYLGVNYERRIGRTADFARADGEDVGGVSLAVGLRAWF